MFLTDEIGGEVYAVGEVSFHKPVITVRERIGVRVDLSDNRQAEHLDDQLELGKTGEVIFLQLTPLQGG